MIKCLANPHILSLFINMFRTIPKKKKYLGGGVGGGGKKANDIFFYGWLVVTFLKLYWSLVFEKIRLHGWWGFIGKLVTDV